MPHIIDRACTMVYISYIYICMHIACRVGPVACCLLVVFCFICGQSRRHECLRPSPHRGQPPEKDHHPIYACLPITQRPVNEICWAEGMRYGHFVLLGQRVNTNMPSDNCTNNTHTHTHIWLSITRMCVISGHVSDANVSHRTS